MASQSIMFCMFAHVCRRSGFDSRSGQVRLWLPSLGKMRSKWFVDGWTLQKTVELNRAAVWWSRMAAAGGANYHTWYPSGKRGRPWNSKWGAVMYRVAHSLSYPYVMGSNPSSAYFHIIVHQPSASWDHWRNAHWTIQFLDYCSSLS